MKRYLISDNSEQERGFIIRGTSIFASGNGISHLFMLVGRFDELQKENAKEEIKRYSPEYDDRYKYENRGYSVIGERLRAKYSRGDAVSRQFLKSLGRKYIGGRVIISYKSDAIIRELLQYLHSDKNLEQAYIQYLKRHLVQFWELMPIQFNFLSTRKSDRHVGYREAERLINQTEEINEIEKSTYETVQDN